MVQVCLNGPRGAADGASVPLTPEAMAESAAGAVAAGATDVHVHPKTPCGQDSLSPRVVAATLETIRARVSVPVGVTTGAWAEPSPTARVARIRSWTSLPDHASVNWHEPGAEEVAAALIDLGVGVEAGIWSGTDGAARFARSPLGPQVLRVLAEVTDTSPDTAEDSARGLLAELGSAFGRPVLLHGEDDGAWPVLRLAGRLGLATRVGLEDMLLLPTGERAASNAQLVTAGLIQYGTAGRDASRP
ncbi:3-keto-5-aminohexanoate cleavage protein [Streptomyces sp. NBC_00287]|uniref:3-keto-5-aminohexanoate cleavage protein n=1 Tax=Streptomyces sp. NBC_00287 TaxID=2975702 RepID=UPI002E2AF34C|nr:3-keto-5-aminohexanoate cleavage protein [Streptomyces sp. NBC_00287]